MREDLEIDDIDEVDGEQQLYEHFRFEVDKGQEPLRSRSPCGSVD